MLTPGQLADNLRDSTLHMHGNHMNALCFISQEQVKKLGPNKL